MSSNVRVSGIPAHVKLGKLIPLFSHILSRRSSDFLLRVLPANGPTKDVLLSLPSSLEAHLAQEKLDTFVYKHNNVTYVFTASIDGGSKHNNKKPKPKPKFQNQNFRQPYTQVHGSQWEEGYRGDRSHSPQHKDTSDHLDIQIEILRKQRMIVEEERKLLEEQRKLDLLKMKSFNNETSSVANTTDDESVEMSGSSSNPSQTKYEPKQLTFHQASGVLLKKMTMFIQKNSSSDERKALTTHIRSVLKERLAAVVAADGQGVFQTRKVLTLYRAQYPPSADKELVKETLKYIRESRCAGDTASVKESLTGAKATNIYDGTKNAVGDHTLKEEQTTAKDTTLPGDSNYSEIIKKNKNKKPERKFEEKLLQFYKASGVLVRKMNVLMDKHSSPNTRKLLIKYLRATLKVRLAAVVAGQPIYQTHKIIQLYRKQYPVTEDEDLIKRLLKDIDDGLVTDDTMIQTRAEKINIEPNTAVSAAIDNNLSQNQIPESDESGQPEIKEEEADTGNDENILKKNINHIGEMLKTHINEKDNAESDRGNDCKAKNVEEINDKINNDLQNLVSVNIEKDSNYKADDDIKTDIMATEAIQKCVDNMVNIEKDSNYKADDDIKTDIMATEAIQKCVDNMNTQLEENRGIKRKNDETEDNLKKVAKTDDDAVINSEGSNENKLVDCD